MFECKYKLKLEDSVQCAKYVYKSQQRKKDKIVAYLIPILMVCMVAMLIFDIVSQKPIVWDIVLLVALVILQVSYLLIPIMLVQSQKKNFKKQKLDEVDYLVVKINGNICEEFAYKNNEETATNIHNLKSLTSYLEDDEKLILIFNKLEYVYLIKANVTGGVEKLKDHLKKIMNKNVNKK